jgi:hypothetical protein
VDYPFENLDPESFQKFCQALLTKEFPNVQCFPVAQSDGGRDAMSYLSDDDERGFIMYQIKFVRNPSTESDPHKWLIGILRKEAPKLKNQVPKGAKRYILITNAKGTAHPETGSIDKVNQLLESNLDVPAQCWWRDDLISRLDNAWDLKWIYPQLMTGPDLIRSLIESQLSEAHERRSTAIRAYITHQFDIDQTVKFKQVELDNRLFDLFIDVPISSPSTTFDRDKKYLYKGIHHYIARDIREARLNSFQSIDTVPSSESDLFVVRDDVSSVGTAAMLLHPVFQKNVPYIVLEGAPGQGKSTITQYICQVYRMKVLGEEQTKYTVPEQYREDESFDKLPKEHKFSSVRLPFRVDLRDLATWFAKRNPFSAEQTDEVPSKWKKSLEAFLAAQVENDSGGCEFDVADLHAVAKLSSILLVFDGLDEVADIEKRREVVQEIVSGVNRLRSIAASLQVIVTSRPAAFANSPGFPEDKFPHYHLGSVTRPLVEEYARKWMRARRLDPQQVREVKKVLQEKLDQPHLRDLARNPMQLTILLSIVRTKTASLPDKRTALYDSYIEKFFDREAEKNPVVRVHRELLIDIHRYLAWILHVESEGENSSGRITYERLRELLSEYLISEGYRNSLVDDLLLGMVERIVALVSRVEGTYEFEVQPLREYFAARYLYETAPQSPPGNEKPGTKPDRFDAIARNFYWLNVTRFYAGCYSKGELADLIDRLEDLISEDGYALISHPRLLAATLLSDWVFTQHPKSVQRVISLILDGIGLRYLLTSNSRRVGSGSPLVLPKDCGQDELITRCFSILGNSSPKDYAFDVIDLIKANSSPDEIDKLWRGAILSQKGKDCVRWLEYGLYLGCLPKLSPTELNTVLATSSSCPTDALQIEILLKARRFDFFEMNEANFNVAVEAILNRNISADYQRRPRSSLELLSRIIDTKRYAVALHASYPMSLASLWEHEEIHMSDRIVSIMPFSTDSIQNDSAFSALDKCSEIIQIIEREARLPVYSWSTEISPWDNLVESIRSIYGDQWALFHLACISSGIASKTETCKGFENLLDHSVSLCKRARYARLRSGNPVFWQRALDSACNESEIIFIMLLLLNWGTKNTLEQLECSIGNSLKKITCENWQRLYDSLEEVFFWTRRNSSRSINFNIGNLSKSLDVRVATVLGIRSKNPKDFYLKCLGNGFGNDLRVLQFWQNVAVELLGEDEIPWEAFLEIVSQGYMKGVVSERYAFHIFIRRVSAQSMPDGIARKIAQKPDCYPGFLVAMAETKCRDALTSKIVKVGEIANRDRWFSV